MPTSVLTSQVLFVGYKVKLLQKYKAAMQNWIKFNAYFSYTYNNYEMQYSTYV